MFDEILDNFERIYHLLFIEPEQNNTGWQQEDVVRAMTQDLPFEEWKEEDE